MTDTWNVTVTPTYNADGTISLAIKVGGTVNVAKTITIPGPTTTPPPPTGFKLGETPFVTSSPWNTPIPATATFTPVAWPVTNGYNYGVNWDNYSPAVYVEDLGSTDPMVTVTYPSDWGYPAGSVQVPIPAGVSGAAGTDGELIVIYKNIVYNFYGFNRTSNTTATSASFGQCNVLTDSGFGSPSPFLGAGTTAIGASEFGGLIVQAETDAGAINHAIQIGLDSTLASPGFVSPAIAGDGGSPTGIMVEGQRLGIPPSVAMPTNLTPLGQIVFKALQKYGAIVNDTGGWGGQGVGGCGTRMQANAYSSALQSSLWTDLNTIFPLLHKVS